MKIRLFLYTNTRTKGIFENLNLLFRKFKENFQSEKGECFGNLKILQSIKFHLSLSNIDSNQNSPSSLSKSSSSLSFFFHEIREEKGRDGSESFPLSKFFPFF